ncbi:MAG: hypothetical protein QNL04_13920 [SAR324 cluster bacterium]|nr:hypothetical protein [SAR324 cluster bacterium]
MSKSKKVLSEKKPKITEKHALAWLTKKAKEANVSNEQSLQNRADAEKWAKEFLDGE